MNTSSSSLATVAAADSAPVGEVGFHDIHHIALSREAVAARQALHEIGKLSPGEQCDAARDVVEIGGVKTFWSRGLAAVPPFIQLSRGDEQLLLVWSEDDSSLHLFQRTSNDRHFERVQIVAKHSAIFSYLPRYAFVPGRCQHRASLAQLVTLRSLLGLHPSAPIPDLHIASATRLIGSVVLEPFLTRHFGAGANAGADIEPMAHSIAAPAAGASL